MGTKQFDSATNLITFTRASSSTFLGSNGLIQTATNNTPRIEYNADGTVKGLLIEEARTNLDTNSETFSGAVDGVTVTPNVATAPDGTQTATKLVVNLGVTVIPRLIVSGGQDQPTNTSSIFAKAGEGSFNKIGLGAYNGAGYIASAYFDLNTGTFDYIFKTSNRNIEDYGVESVGNGWYRVWIKPLNDSGTGMITVVSDDTVNSQVSATAGNGVDGIYIWGHQVEQGAFPTSYIPTSGATATRAADVTTLPTSAFGYNQKAGTVLVEFKSNKPLNEQFGAFNLSDGTPNNRIIHYTTSQFHRGFVRNTSGTQADINGGNRGATSELVKFAMAFAENDFAVSANGASVDTDTSGTVPSGISVLGIGYFYPNSPSSNLINGHIKSIKYYPRKLSDTQLQELTT